LQSKKESKEKRALESLSHYPLSRELLTNSLEFVQKTVCFLPSSITQIFTLLNPQNIGSPKSLREKAVQ